MSYKDLLVLLDAAADTRGRVDLAAALAARFAARLVGLYPITSPQPLLRAGYLDLGLVDPVYLNWRDTASKQAEALREVFETAARPLGISTEWRASGDSVQADPALHARCADLTILGQLDPDSGDMAMIRPRPEQVALASGRPVLIVPYAGRFETVGKRALIAWNASREAARAVADAMPLLTAADAVTVLAVDPEPGLVGEDDAPGAEIITHLAAHQIEARIERTPSADVPIGEMLLSRAADLGADLLVMGAYGHSRTRELLLGGVTRSILASMTIPVLMSH